MEYTALFTGGGTAGHVTPNIALMRTLKEEGYAIHYIGTKDGIERKLIEEERDIPYHIISAGKLRRYVSLKNVSDLFRTLRGIGQAMRIIKHIKPDVVFSKGGFVSVPVVLGARKRASIILHESDYSPGLSNRIAAKYADTICVTFEDTLQHTGNKGVCTGTPIRKALYRGDAARGFQFTDLSHDKPVLLVMGGSLGAQAINDALREALPQLLATFHIVHLCGTGKRSSSHTQPGYVQYDYIDKELPDLFAMADLVLSRAGANAVFEFLALQKPALLIPLPRNASRGDQIQNAAYFQKKGYADVLQQEALTPDTLHQALLQLYRNRAQYILHMRQAQNADGTQAVLQVIRDAAAAHKQKPNSAY